MKTEPPDLKAIADAVPMTGSHLDAEHKFATERAKRNQINDEIATVREGPASARRDSEINRLSRLLADQERVVNGVRTEVRAFRAERSVRIAEALRPHREQAALTLLDLLAEARLHVDILDQSNRIIEHHGGTAVRMADWTVGVEQIARRIAPPQG